MSESIKVGDKVYVIGKLVEIYGGVMPYRVDFGRGLYGWFDKEILIKPAAEKPFKGLTEYQIAQLAIALWKDSGKEYADCVRAVREAHNINMTEETK